MYEVKCYNKTQEQSYALSLCVWFDTSFDGCIFIFLFVELYSNMYPLFEQICIKKYSPIKETIIINKIIIVIIPPFESNTFKLKSINA